jgi:hypothetical protein
LVVVAEVTVPVPMSRAAEAVVMIDRNRASRQ